MTGNEEQIEEESKQKNRFCVYHGSELAETYGNRFYSAFGQEDEEEERNPNLLSFLLYRR